MSEIGEKIQSVFRNVAVFKDPKNYEVFNGRNLPSFIKDYLISNHVDSCGNLNRAKLEHFLNLHIPADNSSIKARLQRGEVMQLLTRFVVSTNLKKNRTEFQIPDMGIRTSDAEIPFYLAKQFPNDLVDGEKWGVLKVVYVPPMDRQAGHIEMTDFRPFRPLEKLDLNYFRQCRAKFSLDEWIDVLISAMEYTPSAFLNITQKLEFVTRLLPFTKVVSLRVSLQVLNFTK